MDRPDFPKRPVMVFRAELMIMGGGGRGAFALTSHVRACELDYTLLCMSHSLHMKQALSRRDPTGTMSFGLTGMVKIISSPRPVVTSVGGLEAEPIGRKRRACEREGMLCCVRSIDYSSTKPKINA